METEKLQEIQDKLNRMYHTVLYLISQVNFEITSKNTNKNNDSIIPEHYTYPEAFSRKYMFISGAYLCAILKDENIKCIRTSRRNYFHPVDVVRYILKHKPARVMNNMEKLKKIIPELRELIEEATKPDLSTREQ